MFHGHPSLQWQMLDVLRLVKAKKMTQHMKLWHHIQLDDES